METHGISKMVTFLFDFFDEILYLRYQNTYEMVPNIKTTYWRYFIFVKCHSHNRWWESLVSFFFVADWIPGVPKIQPVFTNTDFYNQCWLVKWIFYIGEVCSTWSRSASSRNFFKTITDLNCLMQICIR